MAMKVIRNNKVICNYHEHCLNDCEHNEPHEEDRLIWGEPEFCTEEGSCDINGDGSEFIKVRCIEYHED